jgi:hypothetical protein
MVDDNPAQAELQISQFLEKVTSPNCVFDLLCGFVELPPTLHVEVQFRAVVSFHQNLLRTRQMLAAQPTTAFVLGRVIKACRILQVDLAGAAYLIRRFSEVANGRHLF